MEEQQVEKEKAGKKLLRFLKRKRKWLKWIILLIALVIVMIKVRSNVTKQMGQLNQVETITMEQRDLEMTLSASGVIEPQDQYTVVPLAQGEIIDAPFEEGQQVKKGDLLYRIDSKDVQNAIQSAELSVEQAQNAYDDAVKARDNLKLTSNVSGYIKKLNVKKGDTVTAGMQIAEIYDNTIMYLTVPFNAQDVKQSWVGMTATVAVGDGEEQLHGFVKEISPFTETLSGGRIVKQVKIAVTNPGGIAKDMTGTAKIDGVECNDEGVFSVKEETVLLADGTGEIESLTIKEGDKIASGEVYATLNGDSVESQIKNAKTALETAKLSLQTQKNSLDNYTITSPISGQVITKSLKKGDKINASTATSPENAGMAVIYDLSSLKFEMKVDELDIKNIKVGQKVQVTCEALEGETMSGHVENISLKSVSQNGVTQYPVLVRMDKVYDLLPGMNVDSKIVLQKSKNANSIPLECLQRGDIVYVKDREATEEEKNPNNAPDTNSDIPQGFKEVKVTVGINDGDYVEILSGLDPKDEIYVPKPEKNPYAMYMTGTSSDGSGGSGADTSGSNTVE